MRVEEKKFIKRFVTRFSLNTLGTERILMLGQLLEFLRLKYTFYDAICMNDCNKKQKDGKL